MQFDTDADCSELCLLKFPCFGTSNVYDDGALNVRDIVFWTLCIVQIIKLQRFGRRILFYSSGIKRAEGQKTHLLGPRSRKQNSASKTLKFYKFISYVVDKSQRAILHFSLFL
jgi:hypothetical protein